MKRAVLVLGAFMLALSPCWPDIPHLISYQGMLTNDTGSPLTGNFNLTFKIYSQSSGGSALWTETQNGVPVEDGLFNVILGSGIPVPSSVFSDTLRYLGITVEPDSELTPRIRLTSVGYAYRAEIADTAFYAVEAVSAETDGDWTISGSNIYSAVAGSVGIGTTNPAAKLDVNGRVNTTTSYGIGGKTVLSISESMNTFVGVDAGANNTDHYNTFVGYEAGYNNEGRWNAFFGQGTGYSNAGGSGNTFIGQLAGHCNTTGQCNTFLGRQAGSLNATGWDNTFLGYQAGVSCSSGTRSVYVGRYAGHSNKTGSGNVFLGYNAGYYEEGSDKLYIANGSDTNDVLIYGDFSAGYLGMGTISPEARLHVQDTDNGVIKVGTPTADGSATIIFEEGNDDAMALRYKGAVNELRIDDETTDKTRMVIERSGKVGIGTTSPEEMLEIENAGYESRAFLKIQTTHSTHFEEAGLRIETPQNRWHLRMDDYSNDNLPDIGSLALRSQISGIEVMTWTNSGKVGINILEPTEKLDVNGTARLRGIASSGVGSTVKVDANGKLWKETSSRRYKKNIRKFDVNAEKIFQLDPVSFNWKTTGEEDIGLIAEDVEKAAPNLVVYDSEGRPDGVKYDKIAIYLLGVVKDLKSENEGLKKRIEALESKE